MELRTHFVAMARNNAWSNARLYEACRPLDRGALHAKRTSFFATILLTLSHIEVVDRYYVGGLEGDGDGLAIFDRHAPFEELDQAHDAQRAVDARLIAYVERARDDDAFDVEVALPRRAGPQIDLAGDILAHLFVHQIHHRGQVHAMLSGTTVKPPQLDEFFLAAERPIAEAELRAALAR